VRVEETAEAVVVAGAAGYGLRISRREPLVELALGSQPVATLRLDSGVDALDALDEGTMLGIPSICQEPDAVVVRWRGASRRWPCKQVELRARQDAFCYGYRVEGSGQIARAHFFRTHAAGSTAHFSQLFNPEPNYWRVQYTSPADRALITVGHDPTCHGGNWFFTPAPYCFALRGGDAWLGIGVAATAGSWAFADMEYPVGGFGVSLVYDGHAQVNGAWESPRLTCLVAQDEYGAIARYCDALRAAGLAPTHGRGPSQEWWLEPIFCGWGEQVAHEAHRGGRAVEHARQAHYERWLRTLAAHGLDPGTVVIDDKWQRAYGLNEVDAAKWPDLPGFIAAQHRHGRRVLLWLKAWDPEGLPAAECIRDADGAPVAADPGNPDFAARLGEQVWRMLREIGADGFKLDNTNAIPRGRGLASAGGHWGLELQRQWLAIVSEAASAARPDAVLVAHTANPYLADLVDVLRLNDLAGYADPEQSVVPDMRHRARVARAASPYWSLDSDNSPFRGRAQFRDYVRAQGTGEFGIPSLYYAERVAGASGVEMLDDEDYATIRAAWAAYAF
jgi:hypothetical protein